MKSLSPITLTEEKKLRDYTRIFLKRKKTLFFFVAIAVIFAAFHSMRSPKVYVATTQLLIERKAPKPLSVQEIVVWDNHNSDFYKTQYELLKDRDLIKQVIKKLKLEESEELLGKPGVSPMAWVKRAVKSVFAALGLSGAQPAIPSSKDPYTPLIDAFLEKLKVNPIINSRLVNVSFEGYSPDKVANIANTISELYIEKNQFLRSSIEMEAKVWLSEQAKDSRKRVEDSEKKIEAFKIKNEIREFETKREIATEKLNQFIKNKATVKAEKEQLNGILEQLRKMKNDPLRIAQSLPDKIKNEILREMTRDYAQLLNERSEMRKKFRPIHPSMVENGRKIKVLEERLALEVDQLIRGLKIRYQALQSQERSVDSAIRSQKAFLVKLDKNSVQLNVLKREAESNGKLFESLIHRLDEVGVVSQFKETNVRIVYPAEVPTQPARPKTAQNLILALFGGLFFGGVVCFYRESTNSKISSIEEVEDQIPFPLLGVASRFDTAKSRFPVLKDPDSQFAEEIRLIRTKLMFASKESEKKVFLVTSSSPEEGKTTLVSNLALAFAQMGKRVLILDTDLRKTQGPHFANRPGEPGLSDYILKDRDVHEVVKETQVKHLYIVSRGNYLEQPGETLNDERFEELVGELRINFDVILVDAPPAIYFADASMVARSCDGVIFVLESGRHSKNIIDRTLKQLVPGQKLGLAGVLAKKAGESETAFARHSSWPEVIGVVLNKFDYKVESYYKDLERYLKKDSGDSGAMRGFVVRGLRGVLRRVDPEVRRKKAQEL